MHYSAYLCKRYFPVTRHIFLIIILNSLKNGEILLKPLGGAKRAKLHA